MKGSIFFSKMAGKGWVKTLTLEALEGGRRNCARQKFPLASRTHFPNHWILEAVSSNLVKMKKFWVQFFPKIAHPYTHLILPNKKSCGFEKIIFQVSRPISSEKRCFLSRLTSSMLIWIRISQTKKYETLQCFRIISTYAMNQFNTHTNEQKTEGNLEGPDKLDMQRFCRLELFWWIGPSIQ